MSATYVLDPSCRMTGSLSRNGMHLSSSRAWYRGCVVKSPTHLATMMATMIGSRNWMSFVISICWRQQMPPMRLPAYSTILDIRTGTSAVNIWKSPLLEYPPPSATLLTRCSVRPSSPKVQTVLRTVDLLVLALVTQQPLGNVPW